MGISRSHYERHTPVDTFKRVFGTRTMEFAMTETNVAPRFSLRLPMRYRPEGELRWRSATSENVSSSGLRFLAKERLRVGSRIDIEISMTTPFLKPSHLIATSEVVRQGGNDQPHMTAVRHVGFRMESEDPVLAATAGS